MQTENINVFKAPASTDLLLLESQKLELYQNLIAQINKDFNLSNEPIDLSIKILADDLKVEVQDKIFKLIQYKFDAYLNLLYIVDVSEDEIRKLDGSDVAQLSENVTYLILKRAWMKVWFRKFY